VAVTRPPLEQLLRQPDAYLQRGDFFALGLGRKAVDAIFEAIGQRIPGYARPVVRVADWTAYRETFTYDGDRVRPTSRGVS
jgi:hypothetical protein